MNKPIPPLPDKSPEQKPITPAKKEPEPFNLGQTGQPFKQIHFNSAQKQKFWNTMISQMQQEISKCLARARKAAKELKKSFEDE